MCESRSTRSRSSDGHLLLLLQRLTRGSILRTVLRTNDDLGCLYDLSCFQAASADLESLRAAGYEGADTLKIWIEATVGSIVCVADTVPKLGSLATYVTAFCHCSGTSYEKSVYEDKSEV